MSLRNSLGNEGHVLAMHNLRFCKVSEPMLERSSKSLRFAENFTGFSRNLDPIFQACGAWGLAHPFLIFLRIPGCK